jgi:CRISPR-associated protein Cas2
VSVFVGICYDVTDDRRRARVAAALKDYGRRAQRSVFEADLSQDQFERLVRRLRRLLEPGEDSLRIYRLCEACRAKIVVLCGPPPYEEPHVLVVARGPTSA